MSKTAQNRPANSDRAARKHGEELVRLLDEIHRAEEPDEAAVASFCERYRSLTLEQRGQSFEILVRRLEKSRAEVEGPLRAVLDGDESDPLRWSLLLTELRRSLESPRLRAFRRFLHVSGGLRFLIGMRADLLALDRQGAVDLEPLNEELSHLLNTWFRHGFLVLQEITLDSSFQIIRFLKEHEMVHPMASLEEMGSRLGEDRRCFALVHRAMPEEPVVFIEVALTRGLASSIHDILDDGARAAGGEDGEVVGGDAAAPALPRRGDADTVIFYSINNTQNGLAGLGLGKVLIFRVVEAIHRDRPDVSTFATLSPIPGFYRRYLRPILQGEESGFRLRRDELGRFVPERARRRLLERHVERGGAEHADLPALLLEMLDEPSWLDDEVCAELLARPLTDLAYFYLSEERDRRGRPRNPVASFHLGNGARLSPHHVRFAANRSPRAIADSCGMMVNYVYQSTLLRQFSGAMKALLPWSR